MMQGFLSWSKMSVNYKMVGFSKHCRLTDLCDSFEIRVEYL